MMNQSYYNDNISLLRRNQKFDEAIALCVQAIKEYSENNFYYKIMGDIYLQLCQYDFSLSAYFEYLERINDRYELFKGFIRFFERLVEKDSINKQDYKNKLFSKVNESKYSIKVTEWLQAYLRTTVIITDELNIILSYSDDDKQSLKFIKKIQELESKNQNVELLLVFDHCINRVSREFTKINDKYIISILEKHKRYQNALSIAYSLLKTDNDAVVIRTIFRIGRNINDYSIAKKVISEDPKLIDKQNFNIQYELFYYYKYLDNYDAINKCLTKIYSSAQGSLSISRTLYNFYLQMGMIEDAKKIQLHIVSFKNPNKQFTQVSKYTEQESESEYGVIQAVSNLISEQEHNRQMAALRDLLKGFSHELGQPVTNIRYAIQLHEMKKEKGEVSAIENDQLLNKIIKQTERLGKLLKRFSPIVSPKGNIERFAIEDRFTQVYDELKTLLGEITFEISLGKNYLYGDPVQFDQIIYNLFINASQSINTKDTKGIICVDVSKIKKVITLKFSDNGIGIPKENQQKIFEPFFTTKDPSKGEGGDGLGLYIVWNIIRMYNGSISINENYINGVQFIIKFRINGGL